MRSLNHETFDTSEGHLPVLISLKERLEASRGVFDKSATSLEELADRIFGAMPQAVNGEKEPRQSGAMGELERLAGYFDAMCLRFEEISHRLGQLA